MGSVEFVFDECMSHKIGKTLTHCGKRLDPVVRVTTLRHYQLLQTDDPVWVKKVADMGAISVSEDMRTISDHDIARVVSDCGGLMLLLSREISQMNRWQLLRWYAEHLPRLARASKAMARGTTWLIYKDGKYNVVEPSDRQETVAEIQRVEAAS